MMSWCGADPGLLDSATVDLRSLEVFFWVVKLGGFGRAAERLRMTQPAVSGRISQIEARFGVRLLDRVDAHPAGRLNLTPAPALP
jgi:DNA-binding transcriptional LysR family regulator